MRSFPLHFCNIVIFFFLLCSCSEQEGKNSQHMGLTQTNDTLSFSLPKGIEMYSSNLFVHTDSIGHEYLLYKDRPKTPQIFVYDLDSPSNAPQVINYDREGPNGLGAQTTGFYIRSWDEIYVPNNVYEICVIDSSGILKRKIKIGDDNVRGKSIPTQSQSSVPFIFHRDKLFCCQIPNKFKGDKEQTESPVDLIVDLDDDSFVPSQLCYPAEIVVPTDLMEKGGLAVYNNRCVFNDKIIYSFWFSHTLYEYDMNTGEVKMKVAKSRYLPDEKGLSPYNRLNNGEKNGSKERCEMPYYRHIYYDKYHNVFYRFAYPSTKCDIEVDYKDYFFVGRNTASIMVLDEDLNVLGETLLPENCFNTSTTFINKDGLWISCNHMLNPGLDEDHLQFVRFDLKTEN